MKELKPKYFLYVRKSTEDDDHQIMSIEAQLFELHEYAHRENLEILEEFQESKSAKKPGRELFNEMMARIDTMDVRALAQGLAAELFALVCRDLQTSRNPVANGPMQRLHDVEQELASEAALVRKAVFPHRAQNPISRRRLLEVFNSQADAHVSDAELDTILLAVSKRGLIPGLAYDGNEIFLVEEHASWKADINRERKEQIAGRASAFIRNGASVFLDAGSTTEELARIICKRIETRVLTRLTLATSSVHIGDMLSDCCVRMGFDDDFTAVRLLIPGGSIRPNTQAIVPLSAESTDIRRLASSINGFDVCFVGVNGIHESDGFMTHGNAERDNKKDILGVSRKRFLVGDSSKIGLTLECQFAAWSDEVALIIDRQAPSDAFQRILDAHGAKVIIAEAQ